MNPELEILALSVHRQLVSIHREQLVLYGKLIALHALGKEYNLLFKGANNRVALTFHRLALAFSERCVKAHLTDVEKLTKESVLASRK